MRNWKAHKTASLTILAFVAVNLLGFNLVNMSDKVFGLISWSALMAIGLAYVGYAFYELIRA